MGQNNTKVAVLGLGTEGKDLVNYLLPKGVDITVFDKKEERQLDFSGVDKRRISVVCGEKYLDNDFSKYDIIYRSPGIYRYKNDLVRAEKQGVEISSATKEFFEKCPSKIIGVTGTKGKGTTSTLIYEILKKAGIEVYLAGNIGYPYLSLLPKLTQKSWVIMEMSSFQLIDAKKSPHIAVVLNITSDHLDWHKSRKEYVDAKRNIVRYQTQKDYAVLNADYKKSKRFGVNTESKVYEFSKKWKVEGCYVDNGEIVLNLRKKEIVGSVNELKLRGVHNWENITAAIVAAKLAGAEISHIKKAVFSFKGLKHRLELVKTIKGITYYNDSFATGPQPTLAAINSFAEPITLILGGYDKGLDYKKMGEEIVKKANIKNVVLIGDVRTKIKNHLKRFEGQIFDLGYSKMDKIVKKASDITPKGGVVILSPAAASFDMFESYKDRGCRFKKSVKDL